MQGQSLVNLGIPLGTDEYVEHQVQESIRSTAIKSDGSTPDPTVDGANQ